MLSDCGVKVRNHRFNYWWRCRETFAIPTPILGGASDDAKEKTRKHYILGGLAAVLMAGGLITSAPPARAGCLNGGSFVIRKCDGPIQDDGTWQRCVTTEAPILGDGTYIADVPQTGCQMMGPGLPPPLGFAYPDPPTHIDD